MNIPRFIHQTVRNKNKIHPVLKENIKRLRTLNPRWQHRMYDDADVRRFISQHFGAETLRYFKRINPIYGPAKADFFRYLLMYKVGGVYLDVKSGLSRPLDETITGDLAWDTSPLTSVSRRRSVGEGPSQAIRTAVWR